MWTSTKRERMDRFAASENPFDRAVAAAHPKTNPDMLLRLIMDENAAVRRAAVKNPNVTEHMILLALHDQDLGIAAYARMLQQEDDDA